MHTVPSAVQGPLGRVSFLFGDWLLYFGSLTTQQLQVCVAVHNFLVSDVSCFDVSHTCRREEGMEVPGATF